MKNLLVIVLALGLMFVMTGCGPAKVEPASSNESSNVIENQNIETSNEVNSEVSSAASEAASNTNDVASNNTITRPSDIDDLILDDEILDIDDSPNTPPPSDEKYKVYTVDSSIPQGIVYAFFQKADKKAFGDVLTNYTTNYQDLKDNKGKQRTRFLGFILGADGTIQRAFACGIANNTLYCLEGKTDGSLYETNVETLKRVFPNAEYQVRQSGFMVLEDVHGDCRKDGYVCTFDDDGATVYDTGEMWCW